MSRIVIFVIFFVCGIFNLGGGNVIFGIVSLVIAFGSLTAPNN